MNISFIKDTAVSVFSKGKFLIKKNSPEILIVVGVGGIIVGTVMACQATRRLDPIMIEANDTIEKIRETRENSNDDTYSEMDCKKDLMATYVQTAGKVAKLYAPAVIVESLSIAAIMGSHYILTQRNIAIMAAYKGVHEAFNAYRARVIEEEGKEKDHKYFYGIKAEELADDSGSTETKVMTTFTSPDRSQYARFFDCGNDNWTENPELNMVFLKRVQNWANDKLRIQGNLFLNEVYDMLGMDRSKAGAVVGWVWGKDRANFVDFDIFNVENRRFVNGSEAAVLLDFNVDGVIYDLLE